MEIPLEVDTSGYDSKESTPQCVSPDAPAEGSVLAGLSGRALDFDNCSLDSESTLCATIEDLPDDDESDKETYSVTGPTGVLPLQASRSKTVNEVLLSAAQSAGIPFHQLGRYRLMYGDRALDPKRSLEAQGVARLSMLRIEERMELFVRHYNGKTYAIESTPMTAVGQFKKQLQTKCGMNASEQRLLYNGQTLQDNMKLNDYKLESGASLQLCARLHGGALHGGAL